VKAGSVRTPKRKNRYHTPYRWSISFRKGGGYGAFIDQRLEMSRDGTARGIGSNESRRQLNPWSLYICVFFSEITNKGSSDQGGPDSISGHSIPIFSFNGTPQIEPDHKPSPIP
ncbi:MAG: hypothetical protein V3S89_14400, partial [Desulfobacterales bacterium]